MTFTENKPIEQENGNWQMIRLCILLSSKFIQSLLQIDVIDNSHRPHFINMLESFLQQHF